MHELILTTHSVEEILVSLSENMQRMICLSRYQEPWEQGKHIWYRGLPGDWI